jgi:hypothetical protein
MFFNVRAPNPLGAQDIFPGCNAGYLKFIISALQKMTCYGYLAKLKKHDKLRLSKLSEHLNFIKRMYPYNI